MTGKIMRLLSSMAVAAILAFAGFSARADDCRLQLAASLPMTVDSTGRITVPMSIGGQIAHMLIDTGSPASSLTAGMAQKAGVAITTGYGMPRGIFYGGYAVRQFTEAPSFSLAQLKSDRMPFAIMPEPMPSDEDGILGQEILRAYDLDFDFAGGKLNFYSTDHCEGRVVYWTDSPVAVLPFRRDRASHIIVDTTLDGKDVSAVFDTGASNTVGEWEPLSDKFDLTKDSPGVRTIRSEGAKAVYAYPFKALIFGGITVNNPEISLASNSVSRMSTMMPPLLVGINVMRQFHLYVANGENKLYITAASAH
jgi:hypothetical protein